MILSSVTWRHLDIVMQPKYMTFVCYFMFHEVLSCAVWRTGKVIASAALRFRADERPGA
jgi:hypothetical protein